MQVVIAGGGSVGRFIAHQLAAEGHVITLLDSDAAVVEQYRERPDQASVRWVLGDACDLDVLDGAGLADADVVAAVTGDDEDNLVVSLLAKQEFGVPRVIARVNNPKNEWMFDVTWGVDMAVSTPHLITGLVREAVSIGSFVRLLSLGGGKAQIAEVTLAAASPAVDREIVAVGFPRDASVVAVLRDGRVVVPRGDTVLRAGDEVLVLVTPESVTAVEALLIGS
ncbi:MAG: TrkA family potassium uptake protein [Ilumatobacteraceae bacterium]|jgi:trk system potassium uptake protein TrkA|nr:TrkA family potassium uptake protein [Ilumatobacteraceae bacterium]